MKTFKEVFGGILGLGLGVITLNGILTMYHNIFKSINESNSEEK